MRRVSRYDASRQTVAYKRESLGDTQYHKPPTSSEQTLENNTHEFTASCMTLMQAYACTLN